MSHDGSFFCCVNTFNETVSVIDTASFTETHQVEFLDAQSVSDHYTNFTFRNNVLLNEDSSIGFIASAGLESSFLLNDRVYLFDPATGQKIKDDDGNRRHADRGKQPRRDLPGPRRRIALRPDQLDRFHRHPEL